MKRTLAVLGAVLLLVGAAHSDLVVTPGWTDGFFDGSDHQTSGIDVYVDQPGDVPMPGDPVPAEYSTRGISKSMRLDEPAVTPTSNRDAAKTGRMLAILYKDGSAQLVPLKDVFGNITKMTVVTDTSAATRTKLSAFNGKWQTPWGILTLKTNGARFTGTYTQKQGRVEAVLRDERVLEGTWTDSSKRSGRFQLTLAADGASVVCQWWYGLDQTGGDWVGTRNK